MPDINPAMDAAIHLAKLGNHVHYVAEGESRCLSGQCPAIARPSLTADLSIDNVFVDARV